MKIGLVDIDLLINPKVKILNVELMKLGVYYEKQGHQVEVLHPHSYILDYDKLCIFCNEHRPLQRFLKHPNVEFYGDYYNNKEFVSFNNEIDYEKTNYRIYDNLLKYYFNSNVYTEKDIERMKNSKWVRIFPNKEPINIYDILTNERIVVIDNYLYDKENWRDYLLKMSIYPKKMFFIRPQIIKNQEDLDNFKILLSYNFANVQALILTSSYEEFEKLIMDNADFLRKIQNKVVLSIGYNKDNLYSEMFYLNELIPTIKKALLLSKMNITFNRAELLLYSDKVLTTAVYYSFKNWFAYGEYNFTYFEKRFLIDTVNHKEKRNYYYSFLEKHPEYKKWFRKIINEEE